MNQSVLNRLPYGYGSILKQSVSSDEDDMGIISFLYQFVGTSLIQSIGNFS